MNTFDSTLRPLTGMPDLSLMDRLELARLGAVTHTAATQDVGDALDALVNRDLVHARETTPGRVFVGRPLRLQYAVSGAHRPQINIDTNYRLGAIRFDQDGEFGFSMSFLDLDPQAGMNVPEIGLPIFHSEHLEAYSDAGHFVATASGSQLIVPNTSGYVLQADLDNQFLARVANIFDHYGKSPVVEQNDHGIAFGTVSTPIGLVSIGYHWSGFTEDSQLFGNFEPEIRVSVTRPRGAVPERFEALQADVGTYKEAGFEASVDADSYRVDFRRKHFDVDLPTFLDSVFDVYAEE